MTPDAAGVMVMNIALTGASNEVSGELNHRRNPTCSTREPSGLSSVRTQGIMTRKSLTIVVVLALAAAAGTWWYRRASAGNAVTFRFAAVERGTLQSTVSSTGALNAVTTVQVGTQVSGQVSAIYADFNDRVKKGKLLARIDPTLQEQAVRDAQAVLERNVAERDQAQREHDRNKTLFERKVLTEVEYQSSQYKLAIAEASVKSAQVSLDRARRNLAYTEIYAPIDGVVIERNVDVGQTVAASLQAPQLFLIANDLSRMEILAKVDESDIGAIHEGQPVRFTVQPYPDESFTGTVRQVRLQSTTQENVVNYTVVVSVANTSGKLLPGMTATVAFITGSAEDVLMVPNGALRFRPTNAMLAASGADTLGQADARAGGARATLWYLDQKQQLVSIAVQTGLTDGQRTVVTGPGLEAGMRVIVGSSSAAAATNATGTSSPFQSTQPRGPGGGPGGGGPPPPGF